MLASSTCLLLALCCAIPAEEMPQVTDPNVVLELVADSPDVRTPVGITVDELGRVIVVESHTHFRPEGYDGPKADRILRMSDFDATGKAQKIEVIFEGTTSTMSVAMHPNGQLFVATRSEIFVVTPHQNQQTLPTKHTIIELKTKGDYPHNGLAGFAFDLVGNVYFGFGENLGADYQMVATGSGTVLSGGGEGGSIFRCTADGRHLQRVATGFWNPFHMTFDAAGHLFMVDNDPDSRPPCRLIHVVESGDYGYRFRYGRKGVHPLTAWNGELPGTLPMVAGTGEAPSGLLAYHSTGLPEVYRGQLLSTSWGDHRIEAFKLEPRGASFTAQMKPLVTGGDNFRPVGIALAPDGSVFFSDWVDKSYSLHGKGRVWRLRSKEFSPVKTPASDKEAMESGHLPLMIKATSKMHAAFAEELAAKTRDPDELAVLQRVIDGDEKKMLLKQFTLNKPEPSDPFVQQKLAVEYVNGLIATKGELTRETFANYFGHLSGRDDANEYNFALAYRLLAMRDGAGESKNLPLHSALAQEQLPKMLASTDERIRLLAVVWIADKNLKQFRPDLEVMLNVGVKSRQLFEATLAALDLLQDKVYEPGKESAGEEHVLRMLEGEQASSEMRAFALRTLRADHPAFAKGLLAKLLSSEDVGLRKEAIKTLRERSAIDGFEQLQKLATDASLSDELRCEAIMGLAFEDAKNRELLMQLAISGSPSLAGEAVRSLRGATLTMEESLLLSRSLEKPGSLEDPEALSRLLAPASATGNRPAEKDAAAWLAFATGEGDADAGERIFFHPKLVACARCHEHQGRGQKVGPALTTLSGAMTKERLVQSIVDPSREIAPQFTPWTILNHDGQTSQGMYLFEEVDGTQIYADTTGKRFRIHPREIESRTPSRQSIMPDKLAEQLTQKEWRDLVAFLLKRAEEAKGN